MSDDSVSRHRQGDVLGDPKDLKLWLAGRRGLGLPLQGPVCESLRGVSVQKKLARLRVLQR